MKRFFTFLFMIAYLNVALVAQVAERDLFDPHGNRVDDINSIVEFVRVVLGADTLWDDEDDDNTRNYCFVETLNLYVAVQKLSSGEHPPLVCQRTKNIIPLNERYVPPAYLEVVSPPPEA